jgi:hypothetical protein
MVGNDKFIFPALPGPVVAERLVKWRNSLKGEKNCVGERTIVMKY